MMSSVLQEAKVVGNVGLKSRLCCVVLWFKGDKMSLCSFIVSIILRCEQWLFLTVEIKNEEFNNVASVSTLGVLGVQIRNSEGDAESHMEVLERPVAGTS